MNGHEKAAPVREHLDGHEGDQYALPGFQSPVESVPCPRSDGKVISSFLLCGEQNAVPLRQLVSWSGLNEREVRRMIQWERLAGVPILADCARGYFLAADESERTACVKSMRHRAGEILRTADALARAEIEEV